VARAATTEEAERVEIENLTDEKRDIQKLLSRPYKWGFKTIIESDTFPKGLNEDVVRAISAKKKEPEWMLEFRLKAFRKWLTMEEPQWSDNNYPPIDYQDYSYYSEPKVKEKKQSLDEVGHFP
jgi:hypothetical protein